MKKSTLFLFIFFISNLSYSGNLTGKINFKGAAPKPQKIKMNSDAKCVASHKGDVISEQVVVNSNNTLKNVFVYVKKGLEGKKFPTPKDAVALNQQGCTYSPHVIGVMANQKIDIINSDNTLHNVHALPKSNPQFNIAQPKQGMKTSKSFTKSEVMVKVKCDVHSWMSSYIGVLDHPFYAVSDDKGNFTIKNLTAGDYEVEAWHEKLGVQTLKLKVTDKGATADFTFEGK